MNKPTLSKAFCIIFVFCAATAIASPAQVLTTLHSFDGSDGSGPYAALVQASNGNFYGTTEYGGYSGCNNGCGTVFQMTPGGTLTTLHSFNGADGAEPLAAPVQASDGNLYGTTFGGGQGCGANGCGTVFKITPSGTLTTLYAFCSQPGCADGTGPQAGLIQASDGNFYGTTSGGGANNYGTVFKITPSGALTTLHSFGYADGDSPLGALVQASDGNFYGTTELGGNSGCSFDRGCGTAFKMTPAGTLTTLYVFGPDDAFPFAGLVQASDGNFYGTTSYPGTAFKITPSGSVTTLAQLGPVTVAGLIQATDGNFYGTAMEGSDNFPGTVFKITPGGTLTTLHNFEGSDGEYPEGGLVQATDGNFYGTTSQGGANGGGTVFRLTTLRACTVCPSLE